MMSLLEAGADPLQRDGKGQDVPLLIEGLRQKMPPNAALIQRRMALEQVRATCYKRHTLRFERVGTRFAGSTLVPRDRLPLHCMRPVLCATTHPLLMNTHTQVAAVLTRRLYDEVEVSCVLEERAGGEEGEREFLVSFKVRRRRRRLKHTTACSARGFVVGLVSFRVGRLQASRSCTCLLASQQPAPGSCG